ncbi:MAG: hypothetical protein ACREA2_11790 [Blastocatellia bacterium]
MNKTLYYSRRSGAGCAPFRAAETAGNHIRIFPYQGLAIVAFLRLADTYQLQNAILRLRKSVTSFRNFGEPLFLPIIDVLAREQPAGLTGKQREQVENTIKEIMQDELDAMPQFAVTLQGIELDCGTYRTYGNVASVATSASWQCVETLRARLRERLGPLLTAIHPGLQMEPMQEVKVTIGFLNELDDLCINRELALAIEELRYLETELWIERIALVRFRQMSLGDAKIIHEVPLPPLTDQPIKQAMAKPKVFAVPYWPRWCGFSYLWDNPGASLRRRAETEPLQIACEPWKDPELGLYCALWDSLAEVGLDSTNNPYSFCPLPSSSYHVTAWDGINEENLNLIAEPKRERFAKFMLELPKSAKQPSPGLVDQNAFDECLGTGLVQFEFDSLKLWDDAVLVAQLAPAGQTSEQAMEQVKERRKHLDEKFASIGRAKSLSYAPHVSLGYFNHPGAARNAREQALHWEGIFRRRAARHLLAFQSISAYAFESMASFLKMDFSDDCSESEQSPKP